MSASNCIGGPFSMLYIWQILAAYRGTPILQLSGDHVKPSYSWRPIIWTPRGRYIRSNYLMSEKTNGSGKKKTFIDASVTRGLKKAVNVLLHILPLTSNLICLFLPVWLFSVGLQVGRQKNCEGSRQVLIDGSKAHGVSSLSRPESLIGSCRTCLIMSSFDAA